MCVPQTSTAVGRPGIEAVRELGGGVDVLGLAAVVPVAGDLVGEVPGHDAGVQALLQHVQAHAAQGAALLHGRARGPRAGGVDRADALPDEDPRGVEAGEQRVAQRVLAARGVGADGLQPRDDRVRVGVGERVAAARRVLLQRGAAQLQRLAVELQAPAGPAHLAQADARGEDRLAGDLEAQPLERRVARLPELRARDAHARADGGALAATEMDGIEAHRGAGERPAHGDGPRAGAVAERRPRGRPPRRCRPGA